MIPTELSYGKHDMDQPGEVRIVSDVPASSLDDHIRHLCAKVVDAGAEDLPTIISDLKSALHEHKERLRKLAVSNLAAGWS